MYVLNQHILTTTNSSQIDARSGPFAVTFWHTGYPFSTIFRRAGSSTTFDKKPLAYKIVSPWLNYILGHNIAIIAYVGVWFFNSNSYSSFIYIMPSSDYTIFLSWWSLCQITWFWLIKSCRVVDKKHVRLQVASQPFIFNDACDVIKKVELATDFQRKKRINIAEALLLSVASIFLLLFCRDSPSMTHHTGSSTNLTSIT